MGFQTQLLDSVNLQSSIHADRRKEVGVLAETDTGCSGCVVTECFQIIPLFAQINPVKK